MCAELGHCHVLYVPAVLNVVTTGNGTTLLLYKSKPILYLDMVYCKFLLYVSIEIDPFSCE